VNQKKQSYINDKDYTVVTSHLVMSADLNAAHTLFGGRLAAWVDEAAAMFVMEELKTHMIVTKKISEIVFMQPARLGDVLEFLLKVKNVGKTSFTVECIVRARAINPQDMLRVIMNCEVVFVKINKEGRPEDHGYVLN
jgi:acyl-CoA hydrolase